MAFPVIKVNSATGSDSLASGAGPATALTGTAAATDGAGTTVTLDAGTDLSNVLTDGSHVIYLADSTAGKRNFGKITGKAGSGGATPTVTVSDAFGLSLSGKGWAIGGKRASLGGTNSAKLYSNNSAAGDLMSGWIIELESGHTETITATATLRRAADLTVGALRIRGTPGAGTMPVLTFSNNGTAFSVNTVQGWVLEDFEIRNSNATKTASVAVATSSGGFCVCKGLRINHATNKFWKGITAASGTAIVGCDIGNTASFGIQGTANGWGLLIKGNRVFSTGGNAIDLTTTATNPAYVVEDNLIYGATGIGVSIAATGSTNSFAYWGFSLNRNTIHGCSSDGVRITASSLQFDAWGLSEIVGNQITGNGGWGVNFSDASPPTAGQMAGLFRVDRNNVGTGATANTSGGFSVSGMDSNTQTLDPGYTNSAGGDFTIGTATKGLGWPAAFGQSPTVSSMDIGAAQRQEPAAAGLFRAAGLGGGMNG